MSSKTLLVSLVVYFLSDFSFGQKHGFRKDYTYIESEKSFYKIHTTPQTFAEAKRMCSLEGASLFYAEDVDEANAVISWWKRTQPNIPWVFVGLSDILVEGFFETVDGRPITEVYHRWQAGSPDNRGGEENCVHLNLQGNLNDYLCYSKSEYICQKSVQSCELNNMELNSVGQKHGFRKDYTYIESEKSFYKIHTTPQTFAEAKRMCSLEGASLFYAEDVHEANTVISFWKRTRPNIPWVFVGLSDILAEGFFETVDGRPITEVYNRWQMGSPDNIGGEENCVHLNLKGNLNDYLCHSKSEFICKKSFQPRKLNNNCMKLNSAGDYFFRKDYTYIESEESFYKIHTTPHPFEEAKRMCTLEGASLFYAADGEEANAVISFWKRTQPTIQWVFVGLTDIKVEGKFETIDGRPITEVYNRWQIRQPDNSPAEQDCVHFNLYANLNDNQCYKKNYFICKKTLESLQWDNKCNMPNLDYMLNEATGKCYKLHTTPMTWSDAYAMCRTQYTSLAVISNQAEADYLAKLTSKREIYHLGFHNRFNEGWQTIKGIPVNAANTWFAKYKLDENKYKKCGSFYHGANGDDQVTLINTDCNTKSMFICESHDDCSVY